MVIYQYCHANVTGIHYHYVNKHLVYYKCSIKIKIWWKISGPLSQIERKISTFYTLGKMILRKYLGCPYVYTIYSIWITRLVRDWKRRKKNNEIERDFFQFFHTANQFFSNCQWEKVYNRLECWILGLYISSGWSFVHCMDNETPIYMIFYQLIWG